MKFAALAAILLVSSLSAPAQEARDSIRCDLRLKDGSLLRGTLRSPLEFPLKMKFGTLKIPARDLYTIDREDPKLEKPDIFVTTDSTYRGWFELGEPFVLETATGPVKVAIDL